MSSEGLWDSPEVDSRSNFNTLRHGNLSEATVRASLRMPSAVSRGRTGLRNWPAEKMSAKPRTMPKDLVLPVPLALWPGAKARGLPPSVPAVRIPLCFSAISMTCWRCRESRANPSPPNSLLNREKTGNFSESGQYGGIFGRINSSNQ